MPAIGGAILGAIIGGNVGGVIAQGTQLGVSAYFLKYSRNYERQADILGAQIMARAGYDPRDLANMFRTIERESGGGSGPEWLSSHPNPGNRYEQIMQEASRLQVNRGRDDSAEFNQIKSELRRLSPAPTMQEIAQRSARNQPSAGRQYPGDSRVEQRVDYPSGSYSTYTGGNVFQLSVPSNWQRFEDQNSVTFAPRGAYGNYQGQSVFTHGAIVGVVNAGSSDLEYASDQYVGSLLRNNPYLQVQSRYRNANIDGRRGLSITLTGQSPVTGQTEVVTVYTAMMQNGALFYLIGVAPSSDNRQYSQAFSTIIRSVRLNG